MTGFNETISAILLYIFNSIQLTFKIILSLFFPIIICCIFLNLLSREQNRRLFSIGGWNALFLTSWIGTPIHELSHFLAAVIANHKIIELRIFSPDKRTGSMGYMTHSYQENNFYQAVIGNTLIAIAPFFGGAAVIYLMCAFIFPDFSLFSAEVPRIYYLNINNLLNWNEYALFLKTHLNFFEFLVKKMFSAEMIRSWQLYVFLFLMFGVANHLSPSGSDFKNFWQPVTILLAAIALLSLVIYPMIKNPTTIITVASGYIFVFIPMLYLAIFISVIWLLLTYIIFSLTLIFR